MGRQSREEAEPTGFWVRLLVIVVALFVIATGVYIAVTGVWASEDLHVEGPRVRVVGVAVAVIGAFGLARSVYRWTRP
jgi:hypothetical protein